MQNPLRFPGQWADPAAGYFYNYVRDYDATLARYLSVDPLGTGGGRNKFTYAGANPQNLIDKLGLQKSSSGTRLYQLPSQPALSPILRAQHGVYLRQLLQYDTRYSEIRDPQASPSQAHVSHLLGMLREARVARGCELLPGQGIYVLPGGGNLLPYVGQSGSLASRLLSHLRQERLSPEQLPDVYIREVLGGRTQREIIEQMKINELGGLQNVRNERNPIGPSRQQLLGPLPWR